MTVYSVSANQGIKLESHHSIPSLIHKDKDEDIDEVETEFYNSMKTNKIIISQTKRNGNRVKGVEFMELELREGPKVSITRLQSKKITSESDSDGDFELSINSNQSHRSYTRHQVFEYCKITNVIIESFLTSNQKIPRPSTRFKRDHQNLKEIYHPHTRGLTQEEIQRYERLYLLDNSATDPDKWSDTMRRSYIQIEDLNHKQYAVLFEFRALLITKVYDKVNGKLLKVSSCVNGEILDEALKENSGLDVKKSSMEICSLMIDLKDDRVVLGVDIKTEDSHDPNKRAVLMINAYNHLLNRKQKWYDAYLSGSEGKISGLKNLSGDFKWQFDLKGVKEGKFLLEYSKTGRSQKE